MAGSGEIPITGIRANSKEVGPGDLFVALRGTRRDGHDYIDDAIAQGAAAIIVEGSRSAGLNVPTFRVPDTRRALAEIAAAWNGYPARDIPSIGITGTVGKTSVLNILERIMVRAGSRVGTVGSLGVHLNSETLSQTGFTAPDPLPLHEKLAELRDRGCDLLVMEATSHALVQKRLHGLSFAAGIFTNLLPLEHQDYHGTFAEYVEAKLHFFDHLQEGAALVYNADDRAVDTIARERDVVPIGTGTAAEARVRIEDFHMTAEGTRLTLRVPKEIPVLTGGTTGPLELRLHLKLLGRSNVYNCALAASLALVLGAPEDAIIGALERLPAPPRRVQIVHDGSFRVLDDTVGHPDSVNAVFEAVGALAPRRIHIAFAIRGARGPEINRRTAEALAIWCRHSPVATLAITSSEDAADERNRVAEEERDAFLEPLRDAGIDHEEHEFLRDAVETALSRAEEGDLVLLLGAQGMDEGATITREWLRTRE